MASTSALQKVDSADIPAPTDSNFDGILWIQRDSIWKEVSVSLNDNRFVVTDIYDKSNQEPQNFILDSKCLLKKVDNENVSSKHMFQIFKPGGFKLLLKALSDGERDDWIKRLRSAAMAHRIDNSHLHINMKIASKKEATTPKASPSGSTDTQKQPTLPSTLHSLRKLGVQTPQTEQDSAEENQQGQVPSKLKGTYSGSTKNGLRHGHGVYELENVRFEGEWRMDLMHGHGEMTSADGCVYRGAWKNGLQHGEGTLKWPDGNEYHGEWRRGKRTGRGVLKSAGPDTEFMYSGSFLNNRMTGVGVMKWRNGNVYYGMMENGVGSGRGKLVYGKTGDEYEGDFLNGQRHGQGKLRCNANGITFTGRFLDNTPEPSGLLHYEDGGAFRGAISDWKRHGHGRMLWQNGDRYEGQWRKDVPHGQGLFQYTMEACTYGGLFQNGNRHGHGKMVSDDGREYDGMWNKDEANGPGRMTYKNGNWYVGDWTSGKRHGQGRFHFRDGSVYEGEFENGYPHGQGVFSSGNGIQYDGMFEKWLRNGRGTLTLSDDGFVDGVWKDDVLIEITDMAMASLPDDDDLVNEDVELEKAMEFSKMLDFRPGRRGHTTSFMCFTIAAYDEMESFGTPIAQ